MDSITQVVLGAAVGEAVAGRQLGTRRALVWGGLFGALPDFDLFFPLGDVVSNFTYHRTWSHSIPVIAAVTPLFVWLILKRHPQTRDHRRRWAGLVFLAMATHVVLDCFTVYGTQPLWPLPLAPVMWSSVFIIDLSYSVPLLLGVVLAWRWHGRMPHRARRANAIGLALSCIYLAWSLGAKWHVEQVTRARLAVAGVVAERILTVPAPFNTLLWRIVVMVPGGYLEGDYSMVSGGDQPVFRPYTSDAQLLEPLAGAWSVQRLAWFTGGFYRVSRVDDDVVFTDLRMGSEPAYVFQFRVGRVVGERVVVVEPRRHRGPSFDRGDVVHVWRRIWNAEARSSSAKANSAAGPNSD